MTVRSNEQPDNAVGLRLWAITFDDDLVARIQYEDDDFGDYEVVWRRVQRGSLHVRRFATARFLTYREAWAYICKKADEVADKEGR